MRIQCLTVGVFLTNCYLIISKEELGIIDPGGGAKKLLEKVKKSKAKPKYIINTHFHVDHTFATQRTREITGAKVLIHKAEEEFFHLKPDKFLTEGDEIKIGEVSLKVLHTPGHSEGSICLLEDKFIFTGDTLFKDGYGRTDLAGGSQDKLIQSLKKLKRKLKRGMIIYPGHGEIFEIKG